MNYQNKIQMINEQMHIKENFDIVRKPLKVQDTSMSLYFVDGFAKDEILEKMMEFLLKADIKDTIQKESVQSFCDRFLSYLVSFWRRAK